jgi:hypothetical protein
LFGQSVTVSGFFGQKVTTKWGEVPLRERCRPDFDELVDVVSVSGVLVALVTYEVIRFREMRHRIRFEH